MSDEERIVSDVLDTVGDDAFELSELWSIARGPGVSEEDARRRVRDAVLDLERRGHVAFLYEIGPGQWQDLDPAQVARAKDDPLTWGLGGAAKPQLFVVSTSAGDEAIRRARRSS